MSALGPDGCNALGPTGALPFDRDIRFFGAVTGTDATGAITDAIASLPAGGGRVIVPAGDWGVSADVVLGSNIELVGGHGSMLRKLGTDHHVVRIEGNFSAVKGLQFNGNFQAQGSLIVVHGSDNLVFDNLLYDNGVMADGAYANASHGVSLDGQASTCKRNTILSNTIRNCHDIGVSQHTTTDNKILGNEISTMGLEGVSIDVTSHLCLVQGNRIIGAGVKGGVGGIGIDGSEIYRIIGNHIAGTASGLSGIKTQNNTGNASFGLINDNTILDNQGWGIWLFAGAGGSPDRCVLNGNVIRGNPTGSIRLDAGCDFNVVTCNSVNGVAPSNAGAGNVVANNV